LHQDVQVCLGPVPSSLLLCQGLKLHFNEENLVTLKHMVASLLGLDQGGRIEAVTQTVETDLLDSEHCLERGSLLLHVKSEFRALVPGQASGRGAGWADQEGMQHHKFAMYLAY
jgi:hypothetical protein